jgi:hypothetical protein
LIIGFFFHLGYDDSEPVGLQKREDAIQKEKYQEERCIREVRTKEGLNV